MPDNPGRWIQATRSAYHMEAQTQTEGRAQGTWSPVDAPITAAFKASVSHGYTTLVGMLKQPDWRAAQLWKRVQKDAGIMI